DDIAGMLANSFAMSASTVHWQPLVNGYTAYEPLLAPLLRGIMLRLPSRDALQALVDVTGARWLLLHRGGLGGARGLLRHGPALAAEPAALWPPDAPPDGLTLVARSGTDELYAITLPRRHD